MDAYLATTHRITIPARFWQLQSLDILQVVPDGTFALTASGRRGRRGEEGEQQGMHAADAALLSFRRMCCLYFISEMHH